MRAEVPCGRASNAESADRDAVRIDLILAFDRVQRFEQVDLASELVRVAVASIQVQDDGVGRREFARIPLAIPEEVDLVQRLVASVEPRIEAPPMRPRGRK